MLNEIIFRTYFLVSFPWPESHRSEFEIDRLSITRALVGECFDYIGQLLQDPHMQRQRRLTAGDA